MYMYFIKIISSLFIIVEVYEDEVLSRGISFFSQLLFKNNAQYLIYVEKSEISYYFDRKNNNNGTTYL